MMPRKPGPAPARPALASGAAVGPLSGTNGTAFSDPSPRLFVARIDSVDGTGTAATYLLVEVEIVPQTGGTRDRTGGIDAANGGVWLARYYGGETLSAADLVGARRSTSDANELEILFLIDGAGSSQPFPARVAEVDGTGTAATYGFVEIQTDAGTGGTEDRPGGRFNNRTADPLRLLSDDDDLTLEVGDHTLVWRHPTADEWMGVPKPAEDEEPPKCDPCLGKLCVDASLEDKVFYVNDAGTRTAVPVCSATKWYCAAYTSPEGSAFDLPRGVYEFPEAEPPTEEDGWTVYSAGYDTEAEAEAVCVGLVYWCASYDDGEGGELAAGVFAFPTGVTPEAPWTTTSGPHDTREEAQAECPEATATLTSMCDVAVARVPLRLRVWCTNPADPNTETWLLQYVGIETGSHVWELELDDLVFGTCTQEKVRVTFEAAGTCQTGLAFGVVTGGGSNSFTVETDTTDPDNVVSFDPFSIVAVGDQFTEGETCNYCPASNQVYVEITL